MLFTSWGWSVQTSFGWSEQRVDSMKGFMGQETWDILILKNRHTFHWGFKLLWRKWNISVDHVSFLIPLSDFCSSSMSLLVWAATVSAVLVYLIPSLHHFHAASRHSTFFSHCTPQIDVRCLYCVWKKEDQWCKIHGFSPFFCLSCSCLSVHPERQLANSMTSSSSLSPSVSGISKELVEMRHLVQFPEEIACILTEQEQQLYQRVGWTYTHISGSKI